MLKDNLNNKEAKALYLRSLIHLGLPNRDYSNNVLQLQDQKKKKVVDKQEDVDALLNDFQVNLHRSQNTCRCMKSCQKRKLQGGISNGLRIRLDENLFIDDEKNIEHNNNFNNNNNIHGHSRHGDEKDHG